MFKIIYLKKNPISTRDVFFSTNISTFWSSGSGSSLCRNPALIRYLPSIWLIIPFPQLLLLLLPMLNNHDVDGPVSRGMRKRKFAISNAWKKSTLLMYGCRLLLYHSDGTMVWEHLLVAVYFPVHTVCPRNLDPFYIIVTDYMKWIKTYSTARSCLWIWWI